MSGVKNPVFDTSSKELLARINDKNSTHKKDSQKHKKDKTQVKPKPSKEQKADKIVSNLKPNPSQTPAKDSKKPQKTDEKNELLEQTDIAEENISFHQLLLVFLVIFIALVVLLPKVYISNQIYYLSKEVSDLNSKKDVLLEEKSLLRSKIEEISYKQQILPMVDQR